MQSGSIRVDVFSDMYTYSVSYSTVTFVALLTACILGKESNAQLISGTNDSTAIHQQVALDNLMEAPQFSDPLRKTFVSINCIIGVASLLSNALIIHGVRVNGHMYTTTNYFIVNMACGDILASLVSVSYAVYFSYYGAEWSSGTFGRITCKSVFFIQFVSMYCSIYSLVAITFDRFMAVVRPLKYKYCSQWTKYILPIVWMASLATPAQPVLNKFDIELLQNNKTYCIPAREGTYDLIIFCFGYCLPHAAMVILYSAITYKLCTRRVPGETNNQQRITAAQQTAKKVTRMIICTLVAFNLTWCPQFIFSLIFFFSLSSSRDFHPIISYVVLFLTNCNGPLNALIYAVFNENFRLAFKAALRLNR